LVPLSGDLDHKRLCTVACAPLKVIGHVQGHGLDGRERRRYAVRSVFGDGGRTSVGGDIRRSTKLFRAGAVSIDTIAC
jgi:hypothetical protein